jgi:hypothetical protein
MVGHRLASHQLFEVVYNTFDLELYPLIIIQNDEAFLHSLHSYGRRAIRLLVLLYSSPSRSSRHSTFATCAAYHPGNTIYSRPSDQPATPWSDAGSSVHISRNA